MRPAVVALACLHCLLPSVSAGVIPSTANPVAEPEPADAPGGEIPTFAGLSGNDCRPRGYLRRTTISPRSEEHTSELQSLMRISYAVFCLKKKKTHITKD